MKKFYNLELVEDDYNYPISYNRISINHDGTAEIKVFKNGILRHREKPTHLIEAPDDNENLERSSYITKYMTADLENLYEKGEQRYYVSQGLKKPIVRYDLIKD